MNWLLSFPYSLVAFTILVVLSRYNCCFSWFAYHTLEPCRKLVVNLCIYFATKLIFSRFFILSLHRDSRYQARGCLEHLELISKAKREVPATKRRSLTC